MNQILDIDIFNELEKATKTGCWKFNVQTEKLWWSLQTYRIHGVDSGETMDLNRALDFYDSEDQKRLNKYLTLCIKEGKSFKDHFKIYDTHGRPVYLECSGKSSYEDGNVAHIYGTIKDISKEVFLVKKRRDAFLELEHNFQMLSNFFIVAMTDKKGKIQYVNDLFCNISGYSESELLGKDHRILNSGHHPKEFFEKMWQTINSGKSWQGLIKNKTKNGEDYWVQTFIFPRYNNLTDKEVTGFIALRFDVTEKVQLESDLKSEREKLELSSQLASIGELSAGIAHEISNPLTIITAGSMMLRKHLKNNEEVIKNIDSIEMGTNRINKIVKGLHRLAQKSRTNEHEPHNIGDIIEYTFEFCEEALKSRGINLKYSNTSNNCVLLCDEIKISQIVLNLINNARDAVSELAEKWIKIKLYNEDHNIVISVIDSGSGIPDDIRERILEPFYTTKEIGKGTGLGLSLIQKLLKEHNGRLEIVEDSSNTHFKVILPMNM